MTAEIAILNKSAVALASDSAVTISDGSREAKIYFTADKLFELSRQNPIAVMIYNGMQFMQAPFDMLIDQYRQECPTFDHVHDAAQHFLQYLADWSLSAPPEVSRQATDAVLRPIAERIVDRISRRISAAVRQQGSDKMDLGSIVDEVFSTFEKIYRDAPRANFLGPVPRLTKGRLGVLKEIVRELGPDGGADHDRFVDILRAAAVKVPLSDGKTGIVVAGFGAKEIFPTLVSYEIDGPLFGSVRYIQTNFVDIDRRQDKARVLPFAQKEMVERFLYGVDADIERKLSQFARRNVQEIRNEVLQYLDMSPEDKSVLIEKMQAAEAAFMTGLKDVGFDQIRSESRIAIEAMVEFMPKPELATMAEALVNLTSIKRRVSRGMETVGGPIDVAVVSKSEGFVWVKRKHYFSSELNPRYLARVHAKQHKDQDNGLKPEP
jgi:hypothetical protein